MTGLFIAHLGPDPAFVGGTGSVMRVMTEERVGGTAVVIPTHEPSWRWPLRFGDAMWRVGRLPASTVVHVHATQRASIFRKAALLMLAEKRGMPRVVTIHGSQFDAEVRARPAAVRRLLNSAGAITCLTTAARDHCRKLAPEVPVFLVPNPIPLRGTSVPLRDTEPIVLFAGVVGTRKGVDVLEQAWPIVRQRLPTARCVVLGPPGNVDPAPSSGLSVKGPVSPDEVGQWLDRSRLVVLPSRAEAMPMTLLEAMAAKRPFVATPVGQVADLARHGGDLVPIGDPDALATSVIDLLVETERAESLGKEGYRFCAETRSPTAVGEMLKPVYEAAIANR